MYKIAITLKQHTPIIHFQHDQEGATLRATELKPKLDRFLIKNIFKDFDEYKKYLVGYSSEQEKRVGKANYQKQLNLAFDYKIQIIAENPQKVSFPSAEKKKNRFSNTYPNFFANTVPSDRKELLKDLCLHQKIYVRVHSWHEGLLKKVEDHFPEFIATHNFGSRQSKGFGSFFMDNEVKYPVSERDWFDYKIKLSALVVKYGIDYELNAVFDLIEQFYKTLRSGINAKDGSDNTVFYFKSLLFKYFRDPPRNVQWEKKTIKEQFFANDLAEQKDRREDSDILHFESPDQKIVKPLLGLSTSEAWLSYSDKVNIKPTNSNIVRFPSPILFKPFKNKKREWIIYLKFLDVTPILNQEISIKQKSGNNDPFKLYTPEQFDLHDFFRFIKDPAQFNIATHVEQHFHNTIQYERLKSLFDNLQKTNP